MEYIGRYTRRPPISEVRIKDYTGDYVTFEYKDYYAQGITTKYTLKTYEFTKKLIRHIPPHYFNVIRHSGLIASRVKTKYKTTTDKLLGFASGIKKFKNWQQRQAEYFKGPNPLVCKICNSVMRLVENYTPKKLSTVRNEFQNSFS
jgi:hypothetical protein